MFEQNLAATDLTNPFFLCHPVDSRAATHDCFHYQLIFRLFSSLMVYSIQCQKSVKNAHLNFPEPSVAPLKLLYLSKQQPRTQKLLIYYYQ